MLLRLVRSPAGLIETRRTPPPAGNAQDPPVAFRYLKPPHNPAELPYFSCTCGVYAAKTIEHLHQCGYKKFGVHGEVYLWGKAVEHERGWRAQYAYPKTLFLAADTMPFSLSEINSRLTDLSEFGTDIFLLHDGERVALWKSGSGYDAAGLDYLIKTRKQHYVRRQQERALKKGDRVGVLGRGIGWSISLTARRSKLCWGTGSRCESHARK